MFYPGAFDSGNPRKGGAFDLVDETTQDMESIAAAMDLSQDLNPGKFGVYYETRRPTKNELEREWLTDAQSKNQGVSERDLLRQRFASMR
jgi:2-oxoglutarate ferredoxin oxidoreductase subunit beta